MEQEEMELQMTKWNAVHLLAQKVLWVLETIVSNRPDSNDAVNLYLDILKHEKYINSAYFFKEA